MSQRHPLVETIAGLLERIHHGRSAAALIDGGSHDGETGAMHLAVVPMWSWKLSAISLGRKDRAYDGSGRLLMPIRLVLNEDAPIALVRPDSCPESISVCENGLGHADTTDVILDTLGTESRADGDGRLLSVPAPLLNASEVQSRLHEYRQDGVEAHFEFMMLIEPWLRQQLEVARSYLSRDILDDPDDDGVVIADWVSLETIADEMLVGTDEKPQGYTYDRLVAQCLAPDAFIDKEPSLHVKRVLHYEALYKLRTSVGDPKIGSKIRRLARELGTKDIDTIVETYRSRYPREGLSTKRAEAALTVVPRIHESTSTEAIWRHAAH